MITRGIANEIESSWQQANDMNASAIRQFEAMLRAALLLTKTQVQLAVAGKGHWDYSGIASQILGTESGAVADGQYDATYLRLVQAMWASYQTWLAAPISVVVNGQSVTLAQCPLDIIMGAPMMATSPAPVVEEGE